MIEWAQIEQLGLVAFAGLLGGVLGLEREFAGKPAGLRTHIFVAAAAALLMLLGKEILESYRADDTQRMVDADPIRVIQAIVIGISFLGAGTIIRGGRKEVEGLTTAASIFLTSGLGIAVAIGQYTLAVGVTLLALLVLYVLGKVQHRIENRRSQSAKSDS